MKLLEDRIKKDGICIGTEIVKIDSFLNYQLDVVLIDAMGKEFADHFKNEGITKVLTIETSGVPMAFTTAQHLGNVSCVYAKKSIPSTLTEDTYSAEITSFTKGNKYIARVPKNFINSEDRVLIVDDFLATGEAALGLISIVKQAGATCVGYGAAVEKAHQGGEEKIKAVGVPVYSLAVISKINEDGTIEFRD